MSRTVYTLPQQSGPAVTVVTAVDGDADPGAYAVLLDALGVASLSAQLLAARAPYVVTADEEVVLIVDRDGVGVDVLDPLDVDGVTVWDFGTVGLPWEAPIDAPVAAHADDVSVEPSTDEGGPWVLVSIHDTDDEDDADPRAHITLSAREAHEVAADLIAAAVEAEAGSATP